jgi:hypothetical protein
VQVFLMEGIVLKRVTCTTGGAAQVDVFTK